MKKAKGYRKRILKPSDVAPVKLPVLKEADGIDQEDFYNWLNNKANSTSFNKTVVDLLKTLYRMEKGLQIEAIEKMDILMVEEEIFTEDDKSSGIKPSVETTANIISIDKTDEISKSSSIDNDIPDIDDIPIFRHRPLTELPNTDQSTEKPVSIKNDINLAAIRRTLRSINR